MPRILVVAHGHPALSKGGAELAAHRLFREYRRQGMDAIFLAANAAPAHGGSPFSVQGSDRELLLQATMQDYFNFRAFDPRRIWRDLHDLLERLRPDVVHFHHYLRLGLEAIHEVRQSLPDARIVLTLHEYLAICANDGQMIKRGSKHLCREARPDDCSRCFPERTAADFFLRERYIKSILANVDVFTAPSRFLAERYARWGLDAGRIVVVENGQPAVDTPPPPRSRLTEDQPRGRLAYFGQINPFKGLDVLLEALTLLPDDVRTSVHLDVHGAVFYDQQTEFLDRLEHLREQTRDIATFHGPYEPDTLYDLMAATDWVVMPSIWWENSPLVIQEAFAHRRPVICSNIGGMAEKVTHQLNGLTFRTGDPAALAQVIARAVRQDGLWEELASQITPPVTQEQAAQAYLELYRAPRRVPARVSASA